MRTLVTTIAALFFLLFVLTTFVPYPAAREPASDYFFQDEIDSGLDYAFQRRIFFWASTALELALLYAMSTSAWVRQWADRMRAAARFRHIVPALGVGLLYLVLDEIVNLPLRIGRFYHARAWGMSNLDLAGWLQEHGKVLGVSLVVGAVVVAGLYLLLTVFPRTWWLLAPVAAGAFAIVFAFLSPILISPLFNTFTPLSEVDERLHSRVQDLIAKAGIPVQEILVMNASRQSNHTNAYFAGFGPTRRIVLYDTLLKNHTPEEIESVLAHEIGHWQHDHITKGILLGMLASVLGCFALDRLLRAAVGRAPWHLQSPADPAGLPLILLLVTLGTWIALPVENALSRHFERQADQASLELANRPNAFSACEQKMARDNKSNVAPAPWNVWLFSSHPPTVERIHMAEEWKENHPNEGPEPREKEEKDFLDLMKRNLGVR